MRGTRKWLPISRPPSSDTGCARTSVNFSARGPLHAIRTNVQFHAPASRPQCPTKTSWLRRWPTSLARGQWDSSTPIAGLGIHDCPCSLRPGRARSDALGARFSKPRESDAWPAWPPPGVRHCVDLPCRTPSVRTHQTMAWYSSSRTPHIVLHDHCGTWIAKRPAPTQG